MGGAAGRGRGEATDVSAAPVVLHRRIVHVNGFNAGQCAARVRARRQGGSGNMKRTPHHLARPLRGVPRARLPRGRQPATRVLHFVPTLRVTAATDRADCS